MAGKPREEESGDSQKKQVACKSCGERFNSAAEVEQHEKNCLNRKTSGA